MEYRHIPVMLDEIIHYLKCQPGKIYVDGTLGGSGHSRAIIERILPGGTLIGIDQDMAAIEYAKHALKPYSANVMLFCENFMHLPDILSKNNIKAVDGIIVDLGISLYQLESSGRGFSFQKDEPLDMRMDTSSSTTAEDIINTYSEKELALIFKNYGEERWARRIARNIVKEREQHPIHTSARLSRIITQSVPGKAAFAYRIHPATRVFMALRIAVNRELEHLESFMKQAASLLNPKGRLCVLSFHSLEDRIVKNQMKTQEKGCLCPPDFPKCICGKKPVLHILTKKVQLPTSEETAANPMARSAKLRAAEKI